MAESKFSKFLRETRLKAGLNQQQLGDKVGVDRSYISQIERGEKVPSTDTLRKIARVLGVKTSQFIDYMDDEAINKDQNSGSLLSSENDKKPKPKSRIPDMPPDDLPLEDDLAQYINDPRYGLYFSKPYLSRLSNRQLRQIALQIKMMVEEEDESEEE
jgi:transcriptional regulator with XRE-family HTH domain